MFRKNIKLTSSLLILSIFGLFSVLSNLSGAIATDSDFFQVASPTPNISNLPVWEEYGITEAEYQEAYDMAYGWLTDELKAEADLLSIQYDYSRDGFVNTENQVWRPQMGSEIPSGWLDELDRAEIVFTDGTNEFFMTLVLEANTEETNSIRAFAAIPFSSLEFSDDFSAKMLDWLNTLSDREVENFKNKIFYLDFVANQESGVVKSIMGLPDSPGMLAGADYKRNYSNKAHQYRLYANGRVPGGLEMTMPELFVTALYHTSRGLIGPLDFDTYNQGLSGETGSFFMSYTHDYSYILSSPIWVEYETDCLADVLNSSNLGYGPNIGVGTRSALPNPNNLPVIGMAEATNDSLWFLLPQGVWIRSDLAITTGDCHNVPTIEIWNQ